MAAIDRWVARRPGLGEKLVRGWCALEDALFEKLHGVETGGVIPAAQLATENTELLSHASAYHAVWCRNVRTLIGEALQTGIRPTAFIDIGAGKGKACLYAAKLGLFETIVGVEFSEPLVDIANQNLRRFRATNVRFVCADASGFDLPRTQSLIFMFNPFDEVILGRFIERNLQTIGETRSAIAYANDIHRNVLTRYGFETVFRNQTRKISIFALPQRTGP